MGVHKRPEPLITKAKVTATISGLATLLVTLGILPPTLGDQINTTTEAVITAVGAVAATVPVLVHAISARKDVTPVADPRDDDGNRLVPVGSVATVDAAKALADAAEIYPEPTPAEIAAAEPTQ